MTCRAAFRGRKNRYPDLLFAIQYERILAYEALGQKSRSRQELEKLYAQAPNYEVAERLGVGDGIELGRFGRADSSDHREAKNMKNWTDIFLPRDPIRSLGLYECHSL